MSTAHKVSLWVFLVLSCWNFAFPPRVEMDFPEHMSNDVGRSWYFADGFHKEYHKHPDYDDPDVKAFGGGFIIHWDNLLVTQALITLICLAVFLQTCRHPSQSKIPAEQGAVANP